jgi:hypothetical protein
MVLDTINHSPEQNARRIVDYLIKAGLILEDETEAIIQENGAKTSV